MSHLSDPDGTIHLVLTIRDKMTLDLEETWWKYPGAKETRIRELFDETPTRYYQRLGVLLDHPDARAYSPLVVGRLVRLRELRAGARRSRPGE